MPCDVESVVILNAREGRTPNGTEYMLINRPNPDPTSINLGYYVEL
jgi:hypothetical protein